MTRGNLVRGLVRVSGQNRPNPSICAQYVPKFSSCPGVPIAVTRILRRLLTTLGAPGLPSSLSANLSSTVRRTSRSLSAETFLVWSWTQRSVSLTSSGWSVLFRWVVLKPHRERAFGSTCQRGATKCRVADCSTRSPAARDTCGMPVSGGSARHCGHTGRYRHRRQRSVGGHCCQGRRPGRTGRAQPAWSRPPSDNRSASTSARRADTDSVLTAAPRSSAERSGPPTGYPLARCVRSTRSGFRARRRAGSDASRAESGSCASPKPARCSPCVRTRRGTVCRTVHRCAARPWPRSR